MNRRTIWACLCLAGLLVAGGSLRVWAADLSDAADTAGMVALDDDQLAGVSAGEFNLNDFAVEFKDFNVSLQDNQAGEFTMSIAQDAFNGAHGVFTTLQAVNSAVDLTVIVNIFLNTTGQTQG